MAHVQLSTGIWVPQNVGSGGDVIDPQKVFIDNPTIINSLLSKVVSAIVTPVASVADMKLIAQDNMKDGMMIYVKGVGLYVYNAASSEASDDNYIVTPGFNTGRYYRIGGPTLVDTSMLNTHAQIVAATDKSGHITLASNAEVTTGTNTAKAVTPSGLKVELDKKASLNGATFTGPIKAHDASIYIERDNDGDINSWSMDATGAYAVGDDLLLIGSDLSIDSTTKEFIIERVGANLLKILNSAFTYKGNIVWHSGNDGDGSALDAGKLGGVLPSGYLKTALATGATQFLVSTASNAWGVKSAADTLIALGLTATASELNWLDGVSGALSVAKGGTGGTTAATALANLGLTATASELNWLDGVSGALSVAKGGTGGTTAATALANLGLTATAAEINILDGVTGVTAAEISYLANVTGDIQAQINDKVSKASGGVMAALLELFTYTEKIGTTPATTGTVTFNVGTGSKFNITPTGAVTIGFTGWPASGKNRSITVTLKNGATVYAKTFAAAIKWPNDEIPDTSEANKSYDLVFSTDDAGTVIHGACIGSYSA